jgi:hypothetical protein
MSLGLIGGYEMMISSGTQVGRSRLGCERDVIMEGLMIRPRQSHYSIAEKLDGKFTNAVKFNLSIKNENFGKNLSSRV